MLWSVDHPALYQLTVSLIENGKTIDHYSEAVGIRSIRLDADSGFFLNGANLKLKGVCIHDDAGALGVAVPEAVWRRRLITLKEVGCNSLRMSHNPHADYMYKLCDELGFLVLDEAFDEWETGKNKWIKGWNAGTPGKDGYHEYFKDWAAIDTRDMILRNYNHPSIIAWSIGNEIDYPNDPYSHEVLSTGNNPQIYGKGYLPDHPPASRLGELSKQLADVVRQYDTTRPVTAALAGVVMSNTTTYPENLDWVGYNYQEYRYAEDHAKYPSRIIYGSENGMALKAWNAVDSNQYISAQYLWTGIDYLGEAGRWPQRSNGAGLMDLAGFPKP
jgi:beta-galactosidase/beta-glucuronidase